MAVAVEHGVIRVNGVRLHFRAAGAGPPMVLLHGWPQTSYAWRKVMPALAERFRVVAPDLRGLGHSDKPASGYDMRTVATDIRELVRALRLEPPYLVGHDWGGLIARRYALDWPGEAARLAILDIVPHEQVLTNLSANVARAGWHYFFNAVPDLPEILVQGNVEAFLRAFFWPKCHNPVRFIEEGIAEYTKAYSTPGALRGGFSYYRAMFAENRALDAESAGRRIREPVLCLWGTSGGMGGVFDVLEMWRREAVDVRGHGVDACGHYPAEEQPEAVVEALVEFK
ncbi:MAG: alpha/beta hydrolase [Candidatus Rokubacteria bacterium]|nr:alpha/beta hydrolase [Candidatus Rokubacteria bacterium]